jgi:hypothetical protein
MGWNPFKSEEVTRVATSVSRVIADDAIPESVKGGALKAFFNDGNVPDYVMEELVASIGMRAERMYRYAENHYTHGMPSGEVYSSTQGRVQVEATIETIEGSQVSMEYSHYGSPNAMHIGWIKLASQHGYDPATNKLGNLSQAKNKNVYLNDMILVIPSSMMGTADPERVAQWGVAACGGYTPERPNNVGGLVAMPKHTPPHYSSGTTEIYLEVSYVWESAPRVLSRGTFQIDLSGYDQGANFFHAKYSVNGVTKYWMYENDSGTYPLLDAVYVDGPAVSGSYFPFTYFRFNKQSTSADKTTEAYKTSKKMMKHLGMDFDVIGAGIDENPDIADIEQAMLTFAVPSVSTNPIECRYLFDYFSNMHLAMDGSGSVEETNILSSLSKIFGFAGLATNAKSTVIKDKRFKMTLGNNGIYKRLVAGTIGTVGTYSSSYETITVNQATINYETGVESIEELPIKVHRYKHQISKTIYEEVLVRGLSMTYNVYGGYSTVGDDTDDILLIPIDLTVSQNYSISDRETLYSRSLHFVFNSRTVTKVKWYQQGWFRDFMIVVAVVMTYLSWGADGGAWLSAATGLTGYSLLVAMIIVNVIIAGALLPKIFDLFVRVFGKDVATILAVLAIAFGGYQMYQAGSVAGCPFASELLQLSTGLQQAVMRADMMDLLGQQNQFNLFVDEQTKLLDKANELLDNQHLLSPITIFGEKPEDFYNRTVHYGNIGTLGINAISSYVDIALTLPKLNDTVGEEFL